MKKFFLLSIGVVLLFIALFLATPTRTIGTGILLGTDGRLITLTHLVENATDIIVKFPNADDIRANKAIKADSNLLSILQLETSPKIERSLIRFSNSIEVKKGDYVFALFYPIANTQEDQHIAEEGNIISMDGTNGDKRVFQISFPIKPGQSGAPVFNSNGEVIGFALTAQDFEKVLDIKIALSKEVGLVLKNSAINGFDKIISRNTRSAKSRPQRSLGLSKGLSYFKEGIQKNIVLIETGT